MSIDEFILKGPPVSPIPDISLGQLLFQRLDETPDRVAFVDHPSGRSWTCAQIKDKAIKIALGLVELGIEAETNVCLYSRHHDLTALSHIGCYAAGACIVGCYWTNVHRELRHHVEDTECRAIICCEANLDIAIQVADEVNFVEGLIVTDTNECPPTTPGGKLIKTYRDLDALEPTTDVQIPRPIKGPLDQVPAVIFFSTGTTGKPKAIIRSHRNLVFGQTQNFSIHGRPGDIVSGHHPMAHGSGSMVIQQAITFKFKAIFFEKFEPELFLQVVEKYKVNSTMLAPSHAVMLLASGLIDKYDVQSLKYVLCAGAALPDIVKKELIGALGLNNLRQLYGSSEAGLVTIVPIDVVNPDTVGKIAPGVELKIVDPDTRKSLGPNEIGEVWVKGLDVSPGYYNNPKADAENYVDGWLRTGDALYVDDQGWFFIVDRLKEVIKCDNAQVSPAELESILMNHPSVHEAAVIGIPHPIHGQIPKALVVLKQDVSETKRPELALQLVDHVNSQVGRDVKKLKGGVEFIDSLPKIGMGKMDRQGIKKMLGLKNNFN